MNHRPQDHPLLCRHCMVAVGYWLAPNYLCPRCATIQREGTE